MTYKQSIAKILAAEAECYATNTEAAFCAFEAARRNHRAIFGYLGYIRGVWA